MPAGGTDALSCRSASCCEAESGQTVSFRPGVESAFVGAIGGGIVVAPFLDGAGSIGSRSRISRHSPGTGQHRSHIEILFEPTLSADEDGGVVLSSIGNGGSSASKSGDTNISGAIITGTIRIPIALLPIGIAVT